MINMFELIESPSTVQFGCDKFVDICTWNGAMPPVQFKMKFVVL